MFSIIIFEENMTWEELSNENFNSAEFSLIKSEAPKKSFTMTPSQWCTRVNAMVMKNK